MPGLKSASYKFVLWTLVWGVSLGVAACSNDETGGGARPQDTGYQDAARPDAAGDTHGDSGTEKDAVGDGIDDADAVEAVPCTSNSDCAVGPNQSAVCDSARNICQYACDPGYADCNGHVVDGCEVSLNDDAQNCGKCGEVCAPNRWNFEPACQAATDTTPAFCGFHAGQCVEGFVNLDGELSTGCECEIDGPDDPIDADGRDQNCDGVDGILSDTVFVAQIGSDTNSGLEPTKPVASLARALSVAEAHGRSTILMGGGEYKGAVTLVNGVNIYGGYFSDFKSRYPLNQPTRILAKSDDFPGDAGEYVTVIARGITEPTLLDNLTIEGFDAVNPGASTIALKASESPGLTLRSARVIAAKAGGGAAGRAGAVRSCNVPGGEGGAAKEEERPCTDSVYDNQRAQEGASGTRGDPGRMNMGAGGVGGVHHCAMLSDEVGNRRGEDGGGGESGESGEDGKLPANGDYGTFDDQESWKPAAGAQPTAGGNGGGGGGGGAGGNYELTTQADCLDGQTCFFKGGNGGTGGHGGCGGEAGENGQPGGSSFGVAVLQDAITLRDVTVVMGRGGGGGKAGWGGRAEFGGDRGRGSRGASVYGNDGGDGGSGGDGGDGGHGVGGQGGNAIGIVALGVDVDHSHVSYSGQDDAHAGKGGGDWFNQPSGRDGMFREYRRID